MSAASGAATLLFRCSSHLQRTKPRESLPTSVSALRNAIINSAKPFDVHRFDPNAPADKAYTTGKYSWVDQGHGMINLPAAWQALKDERDSKLPSSVAGVELDYRVRILGFNPNGRPYNGFVKFGPGGEDDGEIFNTGLWLNPNSLINKYSVQVSREIPVSLREGTDVTQVGGVPVQGDVNLNYADQLNQLLNTQDVFKLETVMYGSNQQWVKPGTLNSGNCWDTGN